ncbi:hypothetical protein AK830_g2315 [Neonectria ditissima]|uniref:Uncharacterized protein n=1 Tax=Neonectria ditissima TaxID=78410 RepID=A0A0P7BWB6_9HYPO|nr:hypothetical protein AK830_g2315 [Neonectria ditissima]
MSSSPNSPWSLSPLGRGPAWQEPLRKTTAASSLQSDQYDRFPLAEVQALTDALLRNSYTGLLSRGIEPQSRECEQLLIAETSKLRDETFTEEAGLLACLHALPPDIAYGQLITLQERTEVSDAFFRRRVRAYLQCLMLAYQARRDIFSEDPSVAAKELFEVVREHGGRQHFPRVIGLLRSIGQNECQDFLPVKFVRETLRYVCYKENLDKELQKLFSAHRWLSAYRLVNGLKQICSLSMPAGLVQKIFPHVSMWGSWTPNPTRIRLWEEPILRPYRDALAPILSLEGPDTTRNHYETLRRSSPGIFGRQVYNLPARNGRFILDDLLCVFDAAVTKGVEAIQLFITVCVEPRAINWDCLERIEAALELSSGASIQKLNNFLRAIRSNDSSKKMHAIYAALPVIQSTAQLQSLFGTTGDIAYRGPEILSEAQAQLCSKLDGGNPSQLFAIQVVRLGRALASATWLHEHWTEEYIGMLRNIPNESAISLTFQMMANAPRDSQQVHRDAIAALVCASSPHGLSSRAVDIVAFTLLLDDPIWSMPLDRDRNTLREHFLREMRQGFDSSDAIACVKQAQKEHDTFVRELCDLVGVDTDLACVNLTAYLARSMVKRNQVQPPAECWRRLLLRKMRRRPTGLLQRCGEALTPTTWQDWRRNLQSLYGTRHYDPEGGLGFTPEAFNAITARKISIGRMVSTSTYSTASTGTGRE